MYFITLGVYSCRDFHPMTRVVMEGLGFFKIFEILLLFECLHNLFTNFILYHPIGVKDQVFLLTEGFSAFLYVSLTYWFQVHRYV